MSAFYFRRLWMPHKNAAAVVLSLLFVQAFFGGAFAASSGDLEGHVLRSRDSQPVAGVPVQIAETGVETTTNAQGAYSLDLPPGVYTLVVTPPGGTAIQRKVTVAAGKTTQEEITVGSDMSALEQITVLAQRTPIAVAREAQYEAPNL